MQQTWLYRYLYIFSLPFTKASKQSEKRFSYKSLKLFFPKVFVLLPVVHFSNGSDRVDLCQRLFRRFFLENLQNYQSFQNIFGKIFFTIINSFYMEPRSQKPFFWAKCTYLKKIIFDFNLPYVTYAQHLFLHQLEHYFLRYTFFNWVIFSRKSKFTGFHLFRTQNFYA